MILLLFLVSGLGIGAVYAMSGVGLVLLYRASGAINFAFGAMGALAAHVMWSSVQAGAAQGLALLAGVATATGVGGLYGWFVAPLLRERDAVVRSVATLGLTLILLGLMGLIWGEVPRRLSLATDRFSIGLFGARLNGTRIAALAFTAIGVIGLGLFLARTRMGLAMRAVANDRELSEVLGVTTRRVDMVAWLVSGAFAGMAGIFLANIVRLQPSFLTFLVIPALAAVIVARLTSLTGAAAAGLAIGLVEAGLSALPEIAPYRSAAPFLIALVCVMAMSPAALSRVAP